MGRRERQPLRAASWRLTFEREKPLRTEWEPQELFQALLSSRGPLLGVGAAGGVGCCPNFLHIFVRQDPPVLWDGRNVQDAFGWDPGAWSREVKNSGGRGLWSGPRDLKYFCPGRGLRQVLPYKCRPPAGRLRSVWVAVTPEKGIHIPGILRAGHWPERWGAFEIKHKYAAGAVPAVDKPGRRPGLCSRLPA